MSVFDKARQALTDAVDKAEAKYKELDDAGKIDEWKTKAKEGVSKAEQAVNRAIDGIGPKGSAGADQSATGDGPQATPADSVGDTSSEADVVSPPPGSLASPPPAFTVSDTPEAAPAPDAPGVGAPPDVSEAGPPDQPEAATGPEEDLPFDAVGPDGESGVDRDEPDELDDGIS